MKALSIQQPWAWAILAGHKPLENRTWKTRYRGPLAIHASRGTGWDASGRELLAKLGTPAPDELPRGALLGVVDLVDVVELGTLLVPAWVKDCAHAFGPYCWILENPRPLPAAVPYLGSLQLFDVPDHLLA